MSAPGSTATETIPDPPCLSTFKTRGGSGIMGAAFNGHDRSARINGVCTALPLLTALYLTRVGPPPATLSFLPPYPSCHVSPTHLSSWSYWLPFPPPSTYFLPRVPHPFHIRLSPKGEFAFPSSSHLPGCLPPSFILCSPLCHHTYHDPCPSCWPSCSSLKISSYSRWQCEKSSESRNAELAGPLSIPRNSY
jgi:hypothetical protein